MIQSNSLLKKEIFTMGTKSVSDKVAWASITAAFLLSLAVIAGPNATTALVRSGEDGAVPAVSSKPLYKEGELLIKLKMGVSPDFLMSVHGASKTENLFSQFKFGDRIKTEVSKAGLNNLYLVTFPSINLDLNNKIGLLNHDENVLYAEPNYVLKTLATPNDPLFPQLWGLNNDGQNSGTPRADIRAKTAWDIATSSNIVVGIIDTGIDYTHEDLAANIWENPGEIPGDGIDNDNNGFVDDANGWNFNNNSNNIMDDFGHGTHVAGIIGADSNNNIGVTGVAWKIKIAPIKFLDSSGSGTISDAIKSIQYANNLGLKITNNSWGARIYSEAMRDAIVVSNQLGNLFIAAAGNSGLNNDDSSLATYPASYDLPNIISVAATDNTDNRWGWSAYGKNTVDLGAPGVEILSTVPKEIVENVCTTSIGGICLRSEEKITKTCPLCSSSGYLSLSGTSMASPHVAAASALLWQVMSTSTNYLEVKDRLLKFTDPVDGLCGSSVSKGRLNLNRAFRVEALLEAYLFARPGYSYGGVLNKPVEFDASDSCFVGNTNPIVYNWDFGDGTFGSTTSSKISHVYLSDNSYVAKLYISDGLKMSPTKQAFVNIKSELSFKQGRFTLSPQMYGGKYYYRDVNFKPKALIFYWTSVHDGVTDGQSGSYFGIGVATNPSSQVAMSFWSDKGNSATSGNRVDHTNSLLLLDRNNGGIVDVVARVESMDDSGFTLQIDPVLPIGQNKSYYVEFIALGGDGLSNVSLGNFLTSIS